MQRDERISRLARALTGRSARSVARGPHHAEAAVALVLRPRDELELLLIRRAMRDGDPWSGHVAFPGGRRDVRDADLVRTALREAEEETGIAVLDVGRTLGPLDEVEPGSSRLPPLIIAPHVVAVPATAEPVLRLAEVEHARWAPLSALRDGAAAATVRIAGGDGTLKFPALSFEDYTIWGLTYRILRQFLDVLDAAEL